MIINPINQQIISNNNLVVRTIANYLETGMALDDDIPELYGDYLQFSRDELEKEFCQSFILREQCYSIKLYRLHN